MRYPNQPDNPIFTAIGKFAVEFAFLFDRMEQATLRFFKTHEWDEYQLFFQLIGERHAMEVLRAYVRVFNQRWKTQMPEENFVLLRKFKAEVTELIELRNRLMHDLYTLVPESENFELVRSHRTDRQFSYTTLPLTAEAMDSYLEMIRRLTDVLAQTWQHVANEANKTAAPWGDPSYVIQPPRLGEILMIEDGQIKTKSPWPTAYFER